MKNLIGILFALSVLITACKKYAPAPEAFFIKPAYVNVIPSSPSTQGSGSSKITDLFLYVNGKYQGAYESGNLLPIVSNGEKAELTLFAGIKNNGISETTITWLFYNQIKIDTIVESGKTINRGFTFNYNPAVNFVWMENFDGAGVSLIKSAPTSTVTTLNLINSGESFENKSAMFELQSNISLGQFETAIDYALPLGNSNIYLELNYKCDVELEVGVTDGVTLKNAITLNPKSEWNKIYIQIAEAVNRQPAPATQKIYFRALNPNQLNAARVWLDNIKLITL
ncbi:MAG: hypothetical protein IPM51_02410 [Sphingobacteriaceae bacterium]|nr:hypothetical protein [Sphingobacteriaceae bacterium]